MGYLLRQRFPVLDIHTKEISQNIFHEHSNSTRGGKQACATDGDGAHPVSLFIAIYNGDARLLGGVGRSI